MPTTIKIFIGADHAGFALKEQVKEFLKQRKVAYQDLGNAVLDTSDDYPVFSLKVAQAVAKTNNSLGILFCGSAGGACITANKVKGIRAVSARSAGEARLAREDDNANVICLAGGAQVQQKVKNIGLSSILAKSILNSWLDSSFSKATRHQRRINQIKRIEQKNFK